MGVWYMNTIQETIHIISKMIYTKACIYIYQQILPVVCIQPFVHCLLLTVTSPFSGLCHMCHITNKHVHRAQYALAGESSSTLNILKPSLNYRYSKVQQFFNVLTEIGRYCRLFTRVWGGLQGIRGVPGTIIPCRSLKYRW